MVTTIFSLGSPDDDLNDLRTEHVNLDELYEKRKERNLRQLETYTRILNKIHERIRMVSKTCQYCWYHIPEFILGIAHFDQAACIAYVMDKLVKNGFQVQFVQPNYLVISWMHFIPSYVRNEFKKQTGREMDQYGNILPSKEEVNQQKQDAAAVTTSTTSSSSKAQFKSIQSYKPSKKLTYDDEMMGALENTLQNIRR